MYSFETWPVKSVDVVLFEGSDNAMLVAFALQSTVKQMIHTNAGHPSPQVPSTLQPNV